MNWFGRLARRFRRPGGAALFPPAGDLDRGAFERAMAGPAPHLQYVTFFTPRSGSSWVADVTNRTRRLGRVGESFNPNFLPAMARGMNAATLDDYCAVLGRSRQTDGIFGFQITDHQMRAVFGTADRFLEYYDATPCFWLIRRDIVLQGISLYKMQVTRLAHSPRASEAAIAAREADFVYDADRIRRWIEHIAAAERGTEALIAGAGLSPLRMSYERNAELAPNHIAIVMMRHLGLTAPRMKPLVSPHRKIGTDRNAAFARRFRDEHPDFIARLETERAPMLEKCVHYGPKRSARRG